LRINIFSASFIPAFLRCVTACWVSPHFGSVPGASLSHVPACSDCIFCCIFSCTTAFHEGRYCAFLLARSGHVLPGRHSSTCWDIRRTITVRGTLILFRSSRLALPCCSATCICKSLFRLSFFLRLFSHCRFYKLYKTASSLSFIAFCK